MAGSSIITAVRKGVNMTRERHINLNRMLFFFLAGHMGPATDKVLVLMPGHHVEI